MAVQQMDVAMPRGLLVKLSALLRRQNPFDLAPLKEAAGKLDSSVRRRPRWLPNTNHTKHASKQGQWVE